MLEFLRGKASDRKLRLFACACCRHVWESLTPHRSRRSVETAERYADGDGTEQDLHRARSGACSAAHDEQWRGSRCRHGHPALARERRLFFAAEPAHPHKPFLIGRFGWVHADEDVRAVSPSLLRCIFGNPFRPAALRPEWLTPDAVALAKAAFEQRCLPRGILEAARLGVLADALEEAGCSDVQLLGHLRGGDHVRGCHAVDSS